MSELTVVTSEGKAGRKMGVTPRGVSPREMICDEEADTVPSILLRNIAGKEEDRLQPRLPLYFTVSALSPPRSS